MRCIQLIVSKHGSDSDSPAFARRLAGPSYSEAAPKLAGIDGAKAGNWRLNRMIPINSFASGVLAEIVRRQPASKERNGLRVAAGGWTCAGPGDDRRARRATVLLTVRAVDPRWLAEVDARARGRPAEDAASRSAESR